MGSSRKKGEQDSWLEQAERRLRQRFRNRAMLRAALSHPSTGSEGGSFERLEFLGDAVLTLLMSLHLYRKHPDLPPGGLTRLRASMVSRPKLAQAAKHVGLPAMIRLGKSEEPEGRQRPRVLAAAFEAVVAALWIDQGLRGVTKFLRRHLLPAFPPDASLDPKSELQNLLQAVLKIPPRYGLVQRRGPPHAQCFTAEVEVRGRRLGRGEGRSRREAEQAAALSALRSLQDHHNILRSLDI